MPAMFGMANNAATQSESEMVEASTPWMAASDGKLGLLQSSLEALGLRPTATDENGYTLLHAAAAYCQIPIMEWLIQQRADVNAGDNDGDTPLHHVDQVEAAKYLITVGKADAKKVNNEGKTPLQAKQEDLEDQMGDDDEDDEEVERLRAMVTYLSSVGM